MRLAVRTMKDLLVSLTDDHVVLSWLAHRLRNTNDPYGLSVLFNELAKALGMAQSTVSMALPVATTRVLPSPSKA